MAGTYTQIYIHVVIAVKGRQNLICHPWDTHLHRYIAGIIKGKGMKPIIVNGMPDHLHIFIGMLPSMAISDLVRDIKNNASNFVNDNKFVRGKFSWQEGFGAFQYSKSQVETVYEYIKNQEDHHKIKTFKEEYMDLLNKFEIEYKEKHLFDWIDNVTPSGFDAHTV